MDGLDVVHATFQNLDGQWSFQIENAETIPFPVEWQERLATVGQKSGQDLLLTDLDFGRWMAHPLP